MSRSPYVKHSGRLADLIAAIQVLGTYRFATRPVEKWEKRLGRAPVSAAAWSQVFREHPEFFTFDNGGVSLVWRRSKVRNYDTSRDQLLSLEEASALAKSDSADGERVLSRGPLDSAQVVSLVEIAIGLHEREIQHQQERRWWLGALLVIVGILLGALLKT